ncbi:MAG: aspartyl protease family protein [Verrucomicrobiae bacterium]|nr:aspartyl protease family protein [Verrucomicrobiae bacterium]
MAVLVAGCVTSRQQALSPEQEQQLRQNLVTPVEAGLTITHRQGAVVVRWREMVRPEDPVTVPMIRREENSHQPRIFVRLNGGRAVPVVVDTGAPVNLLEADTALDNFVQTLDPQHLRHAFQGLAGAEEAWFGMVRQVTIGPELALRNVFTAIRGARHERRLGGWLPVERWKGDALGMSTLSQFAFVQLDYRGGAVTFSHREYFAPPAAAVAQAPLIWTNAQLRVPLRLGGREYAALVDTGNDAALMLSSNVVQALGWAGLAAKGRREVYVGLGGERVLRRFSVPEMRLGEAVFQRVPAVSGPEEFGVVLGSGFFYRYCVTLDLRRRQMWVEQGRRR